MDLLKIIASILLLYSSLTQESQVEEKTTNYPIYAHQAIDILKKEVEEKYKVHCYGRGGSLPYDIMSISVDFEANKPATIIEESRILFVSIYEKFRIIINEHENIRPFLREYPFPSQRIELCLSYDSPAKQKNLQKGIEYVSCIKGIVRYKKRNPHTGKYETIYQEPYEEALQIVNSNR